MEKKLFLAITISLLFLFAWSGLVSRFYPIENKTVVDEQTVTTTDNASPSRQIKPEIAATPTNKLTSLDYPGGTLTSISAFKSQINFAQNYAAIKEVKFTDYGLSFPLQQGLLLGQDDEYAATTINSDEAIFIHHDSDKEIIKHFRFSNSNYSMMLEISIRNMSDNNLNLALPLALGVLNFPRDKDQMRFQNVTISAPDKVHHLNGRKALTIDNVDFVALRDRYFCIIVEPLEQSKCSALIRKLSELESVVVLEPEHITLATGQEIRLKYRIYIGPQELRLINAVQPNWSVIMHYGTFNIIAHLILNTLEFVHARVHNWGWTIIILSLLIYFLFYPLTLKQMRSMKHMQTLQPIIEELRKTYKDNPQKLNKETMELYRKNKVNPFSGCLPMLVQIPVFFALYQTLMRSIALKGARFLWIKDLSEPDRLFMLSKALPIIGNEINILPLAMMIGMFFQQKLSMTSAASGTSAEQQKLMLIIFPVVFGLIFYHMPAGLVLYWAVNSLLMLAYQIRTSKLK